NKLESGNDRIGAPDSVLGASPKATLDRLQSDDESGTRPRQSWALRLRILFLPLSIECLVTGAQFIIQNREAINRGGLGAQDERPESYGRRAGGFYGLNFLRGEIAFGTYPNAHRTWFARMPFAERFEVCAWMPSLT